MRGFSGLRAETLDLRHFAGDVGESAEKESFAVCEDNETSLDVALLGTEDLSSGFGWRRLFLWERWL